MWRPLVTRAIGKLVPDYELAAELLRAWEAVGFTPEEAARRMGTKRRAVAWTEAGNAGDSPSLNTSRR